MSLRCSMLPLAFKCPGAINPAPGEILMDPIEEGGQLGSAVHEALAQLVTTGELPDLRPVALKYETDADELGRLVYFGTQAWNHVRDAFPDPLVEEQLGKIEEVPLTGHMDVLALGPEQAAILDWKSAYKQADYYHQLMGYAWLIFQYTAVKSMRCTLVWLREQTVETISVTRDAADRWFTTLRQGVLQWDGVYHPGDHCQFCRRFATCPARRTLVQAAVEEMTGEGLAGVETEALAKHMPALVSLYRSGKLALVKQVLTRIDQAIRQHIQVHGPIALTDTTELALVEVQRDQIDPLLAWPVISKYLTDEELAPAVRLAKGALLDAVAAKAKRGEKGKAKGQVMEELTTAGAVSKESSWQLKERKIQKEIAP